MAGSGTMSTRKSSGNNTARRVSQPLKKMVRPAMSTRETFAKGTTQRQKLQGSECTSQILLPGDPTMMGQAGSAEVWSDPAIVKRGKRRVQRTHGRSWDPTTTA